MKCQQCYLIRRQNERETKANKKYEYGQEDTDRAAHQYTHTLTHTNTHIHRERHRQCQEAPASLPIGNVNTFVWHNKKIYKKKMN